MLTFTITAFLSLFVTINPFGSIPILLTITEEVGAKAIRVMVRRAAVVMALVLMLFAVVGQPLMAYLHLSLPAIRIAGGIILFLIALNMIQAERPKVKSRPEEEAEAMDKEDVSIVPLAVPMLAGPGAITTVLVLSRESSGLEQWGVIVAAIVVVGFIAYLILSRAALLLQLLGRTGINVFTRLMGLLLAAMAVQFVLNGLREAL